MELRQVILEDSVDIQTDRLSLPINGNTNLKLEFRNRKYSGRWYVSAYDVVNQKYLVTNVPLLCSENEINNLLAQFGYMDIGFAYVEANDSFTMGVDPEFDNISGYKVVWGDSIE